MEGTIIVMSSNTEITIRLRITEEAVVDTTIIPRRIEEVVALASEAVEIWPEATT